MQGDCPWRRVAQVVMGRRIATGTSVASNPDAPLPIDQRPALSALRGHAGI